MFRLIFLVTTRYDAEAKRRDEELAREREVHAKTRSDVVIKYFSENSYFRKKIPVATMKEGFGAWKEQFMHEDFAEREAALKEIKETETRLLEEEHRKTRRVHVKARGDMLVKYFAERVSPELHDVAATKEAFGAWNEEFIHNHYAELTAGLRNDREEAVKAHEVRIKTRSDMIVKYFSERVSPALHDTAAKKEVFGVWNEEFIHARHAKLRQLMAEEHVKGHKVHVKARSGMVIKYFSERVAPAVHDAAARREAFGNWVL
jgi:hypothetical protein